MTLSDYKNFLSNQCANCSLFMTNNDCKWANIRKNSKRSRNSKDDDISSTEAILDIYGISSRYLVEKLKSYFIEQNCYSGYEEKQLNIPGSLEETVLVLCKNCGPVFTELYKISKRFRNLSDKNSLISKILNVRGLEASSVDEKENGLDIKVEPCECELEVDPFLSDEQDLSLRDFREDEDIKINVEHKNDITNFENEYENEVVNTAVKSRSKTSHHRVNSASRSVPVMQIKKRNRKQNFGLQKLTVSVEKLPSAVKIIKQTDDNDELSEIEESKLQSRDYSDDDFPPPKSDVSDESEEEISKRGNKKRKITKPLRKRSNLNESKYTIIRVGEEGESSSENVTSKYKCKECGIICETLTQFRRHLLSTHSEGMPVHREKIHGPPYQCPLCDSQFKRLHSLYMHCFHYHKVQLQKQRITRKSKQNIKCADCQSSFDTSIGFVNHQRQKHGKKYFMCSSCPEVFPLQTELDSHMISQHSGEQNKNGLPTDDVTQQLSEDLFACRPCNYSFSSRSSYITHQHRSHNAHRNYDCKNCEETFVSLFTFLTHSSDVHKQIVGVENYSDEFVCTEPECGQIFFCEQNLKSHLIKSNHSGFTITCPFCGKTFSELKGVQSHKQKEHKERLLQKPGRKKPIVNNCTRTYKCTSCEETFESVVEMTNHKLIHPTIETVFKCNDCPLSYAKYDQWANHNLVHRDICKDYQCETCGRKFNGIKQYRLHCRQHAEIASGIRPICELCGKSFNTRKLLGKHKGVIHFGREKKTCHLCGHVSKTNYNFNLHMKVHDKNGILRKRKNQL